MPKNDDAVGPGAEDEARFIASVRRLREFRGWSQGELAKRMVASGWEGFHQTTISRIEKGERPVRLGEARGLAAVLETNIDRMLLPATEAEEIEKLVQTLESAAKARVYLANAVKAYLTIQEVLGLQRLNIEGPDGSRAVTEEVSDLLRMAEDYRNTSAESVFRAAIEQHLTEFGPSPQEVTDGEHSEKA